jgi:hypothetical protein
MKFGRNSTTEKSEKFFLSWLANIPLITDQQPLDTREHITQRFAFISRRRRGCLPSDDARRADDQAPMYPPVIFVFGSTIALRRHVTKRAAAFGTRQMTDGQRKPVNDVDWGVIRPSRIRKFFLESLLYILQIGCLSDKTAPRAECGEPRRPVATKILPHVLFHVDASKCPDRFHGQHFTVR